MDKSLCSAPGSKPKLHQRELLFLISFPVVDKENAEHGEEREPSGACMCFDISSAGHDRGQIRYLSRPYRTFSRDFPVTCGADRYGIPYPRPLIRALFPIRLEEKSFDFEGAEDVSTSSCAEYVSEGGSLDYGPDETEIVGPSPFITFNGTQTLTLTCNATVIPTPNYQWLGEDCENGNTENTCRYTPSTTDDGKSVVCVASNRKFSPWKRVRSDPYYFNLLSVPEDDVVIASNHTAIIVGGVVAAVVFLIILGVIIFLVFRRRKQEYTNQAFTPTTDNDSGMGMNGHSSPAEMSDVNLEFNAVPRELGGAGYACVGEFPPPRQKGGESTKKSGRAAAYEVTSIASTGKVNIKPAAPQPNAYQDPWDTKNDDMTLADAPGGPPTPHNVGPEGDEYPTVSNANNKTTITVGPKGDVYSTVVKHAKGDNTQGSPAKTQGQEDAAASRGPPLSMTSHPLDTPGYATLAQMAPDQGNQGDVTSSSGDAAASGSPVKNTSSSGDGTDFYDHFQRDGHDPKFTSQGPDVQYSHIGNY
ncbi:hypothetical protein BaRGS_00030420 [Batillaria attramentaria]|uniref:Ig-like domain-containing protein n=1 Tax=Batillaria attramentaria TaxID=370345 RepID=A0ABD0JUH8_9CAEN